MSNGQAAKVQLACMVSPEVKSAFEKLCGEEGKSSVSSGLAELVTRRLSEAEASAAGIEDGSSPPSLRGELAALAVLFLSARHRVSRTADAIELVREVYLSGAVHAQLEAPDGDEGQLL